MNFGLADWAALSVLVISVVLAFKFRTSSLTYRYRDVIVSRWQDADFYLGKPTGTEFEYKPNDPNCVWSQIVKRDNWKCWKCKRKVLPYEKAVKKFGFLKFRIHRWVNVDHKVPYSRGGQGNTKEDGITSCYKCNIRRSNRVDEMCLQRVRELGKKIYIGNKVPKYKSTRKKRNYGQS